MHIPDYKLLQSCGRGAYGEVWLAESITGKQVALKYLARSIAGEKEFAGLLNYAELPDSPHLIRILHTGETEDGYFYTMELADGRYIQGRYIPVSLAEMLKERSHLPPEEVLSLGLDLLDGLSVLHQAGMVHRDIKPENILYVNGVPKLSDIGLLRSVSQTLSFGGTLGFIPPEHLTPGSQSGNADDLFALGKVLYCAMTGNKVENFPSVPAAMIQDSRCARLNQIIQTACGPEPLRFQDVHDFEQALRSGLPALKQLNRLHRKLRPVMMLLAGLLLLGLCIWIGWKLHPKQQSSSAVSRTIQMNTAETAPPKTKIVPPAPADEKPQEKNDKAAAVKKPDSGQQEKNGLPWKPWQHPDGHTAPSLYGGMLKFSILKKEVTPSGRVIYNPRKGDGLHRNFLVGNLDRQPRQKILVYSAAKEKSGNIWNTSRAFPIPTNPQEISGMEGFHALKKKLPAEYMIRFQLKIRRPHPGGHLIHFMVESADRQLIHYSWNISVYPGKAIVRTANYLFDDGYNFSWANRNPEQYLLRDSFQVEIVRTDLLFRIYLDDLNMIYLPSYFPGGIFGFNAENIGDWELTDLEVYDIAHNPDYTHKERYQLPIVRKRQKK